LDLAFGSAIMSDYIFRGVTQSNHKPSVAAYFEPRYNVNKDLQLYSASPRRAFPSPTAPQLKSTSRRHSSDFGAFAFDIGVWATCIRAEPVLRRSR